MTSVLPHRTLEKAPELRLVDLEVDGVPRPDLVEQHLERIDMTAAQDGGWKRVRLRMELIAPEDEIAALLDDGIEPRATVVARCAATKLRIAHQPTPGEDESRWDASFELFAHDLRDKVTIRGEVVADIDGRPARRIGTSVPWTLYSDETAVPPFEGTFQVRWSHFVGAERDPTIPEQAGSESFFVDLAGSVPAIHLNGDLDGLRELFSGGVERPPLEAALREAEMRRIATAAWTAAIGASAAAIRLNEETGSCELPETRWMADILRWSLPIIYPDVTEDEAVARVRKELVGSDAVITQVMIQLAVSSHMGAGKLLQKALKTQEVLT